MSFDTSSVTTMHQMFSVRSSACPAPNLQSRPLLHAACAAVVHRLLPPDPCTSPRTACPSFDSRQGASAFNQPLSNVTTAHHSRALSHTFDQPLRFDTSNVNDMSGMFRGATTFNQPLRFDTSNVNDMSGMFRGATAFDKPLIFATIKVTDMSGMFRGATAFDKLLSFNTIKVTDMSGMFRDAMVFNKPLSFNTIKVTDMSAMFRGALAFNRSLGVLTSRRRRLSSAAPFEHSADAPSPSPPPSSPLLPPSSPSSPPSPPPPTSRRRLLNHVFTSKAELETAVQAFDANSTGAIATYGPTAELSLASSFALLSSTSLSPLLLLGLLLAGAISRAARTPRPLLHGCRARNSKVSKVSRTGIGPTRRWLILGWLAVASGFRLPPPPPNGPVAQIDAGVTPLSPHESTITGEVDDSPITGGIDGARDRRRLRASSCNAGWCVCPPFRASLPCVTLPLPSCPQRNILRRLSRGGHVLQHCRV
mgnify:CR=1 FL=1